MAQKRLEKSKCQRKARRRNDWSEVASQSMTLAGQVEPGIQGQIGRAGELGFYIKGNEKLLEAFEQGGNMIRFKYQSPWPQYGEKIVKVKSDIPEIIRRPAQLKDGGRGGGGDRGHSYECILKVELTQLADRLDVDM